VDIGAKRALKNLRERGCPDDVTSAKVFFACGEVSSQLRNVLRNALIEHAAVMSARRHAALFKPRDWARVGDTVDTVK
jgi:hypothetical protein